MTPCHSLFSVVSRNSFLTLTGSVYRFHIPMPPLCHGDAPVPAPAATVWCVSSFFFFFFMLWIWSTGPTSPSRCHACTMPSSTATVSRFLLSSFRASGLAYRHSQPPLHRGDTNQPQD